MNVILSKSLTAMYDNFTILDDCSKLSNLENIDVLIIHDISTDDLEVGIAFPKWINSMNIKVFVYMNETLDIRLKMLVNAVNEMGLIGVCTTDVFYLDDEDDLNLFIKEIRTTDVNNETQELVTSNGGIINSFLQMVAKGDARANSEIIKNQVSEALDGLLNLTIEQLSLTKEMSASTYDTFDRIGQVLEGAERSSNLLREQIAQLEASSMSENSRPAFSNSVSFFPTYKYTGLAKVLYVREYAPCRYLTSFLIAYQHYLHFALSKKVKLVFVIQRGYLFPKRYDEIISITPESEKYDALYAENVIYTNDPKEHVLRKLFEQEDEVYIFVDRLYQKQPILSGRVSTVNALSGDKDVDRYDVNPERSIFSIDTGYADSIAILKKINGFPEDANAQYGTYYKFYKQEFEKLDKIIGLLEATEG